MKNKIAILGGDLRIVKLANMLSEDEKQIYTYGLEKSEELNENIKKCKTITEAMENAEIIIGPIPFSSNGKNINTPFSDKQILIKEVIENEKILIAGAISSEVYELVKHKNMQIIDIMKREELAILNAIATAEGAIQVAIENTDINLHGSEVLILGFGRIGKVLAKKLKALSVNVTCAARKEEDIAWIEAYGYKSTDINNIGKNLNQYDIIINTVPHMILSEDKLKNVRKECLLIDLASRPGGIDVETVKKEKFKFVWALSLPGKVAPTTSAKYIKDTIYNILKEIKNNTKEI